MGKGTSVFWAHRLVASGEHGHYRMLAELRAEGDRISPGYGVSVVAVQLSDRCSVKRVDIAAPREFQWFAVLTV